MPRPPRFLPALALALAATALVFPAAPGRAAPAAAPFHASRLLFAPEHWHVHASCVVDGRRLLVPLYSDGFDFSLMALSDDDGETWRPSTPLLGAGNIQPSVVRRRDGSLYTLMRDNGPPPKRLHQSESRDGGETWSPVTDSALPNPGSGAEVIALRGGVWALISNDTESGRHRLAVQLSADEGRTWPWRRALEDDPPGAESGRYHYPSLIQAADGSLHATYSHFMRAGPGAPAGTKELKAIKHAHFNEAWVRAGGAPGR